MIKSILLRGKRVFAFKSKEQLLNYISDKHAILIAMNAEKILKNDPNLTYIINNNIGYPDGVGAVVALRRKGEKAIKIPGVELWINIIKKFHQSKSFYLIGASQNVVNQTVKSLHFEFKDINIKNYRNGYISDEYQFETLKQDLIKQKPDIVFVAMGTPRQEFLMSQLIKEHSALYMGLGGSFDVYSGNKSRAPILFQKMNLEWFYRLLKEPTRIKRQLILWKFLFLLSFRKL